MAFRGAARPWRSHVKITPLEVHNHQFGNSFRGYDRDEVRSFLAMISEEFEQAISEGTRIKDQMVEVRDQLTETKSREKSIQRALESADRISKEIKDTARRESEVLIKEARLKANKILEHAQSRVQGAEDRVHELKSLQSRFEHRLRAMLEEHVNIMDRARKEESGEEKLFLLQRPTSA
ncbi:MAG: DivIVA domain-containing protein [Acidobacteria bacterium]|nr:MAG: DivIVA domain-containing protein [Acidobacteriota bacterium]